MLWVLRDLSLPRESVFGTELGCLTVGGREAEQCPAGSLGERREQREKSEPPRRAGWWRG